LFCIPGYPEDSTFLKANEKAYLLSMLAKDAGKSRPNHYSSLVIKECLFDPKIWLGYLSFPSFFFQKPFTKIEQEHWPTSGPTMPPPQSSPSNPPSSNPSATPPPKPKSTPSPYTS
jgi:hypothetical protein